MAYTISLTENQVQVALRAFILDTIGSGVEVVAGQDNRVPPPAGPSYIELTPISRQDIEWSSVSYVNNYPTTPTIATETFTQPVKLGMQLDVYGPTAGDLMSLITTVFQQERGASFLDTQLAGLAPLYSTDPHQAPLLNGEQQYQTRYTATLYLQCDPAYTTTQQFASTVTVGVISAETYPI